MNWYKKAQEETEFAIWLGKEIARVTNNYKFPLPHFSILEGIKRKPEDMVPIITEWYKETNPDLSRLTLTDAMIEARNYLRDKNELV
jgi:hypothetical protein